MARFHQSKAPAATLPAPAPTVQAAQAKEIPAAADTADAALPAELRPPVPTAPVPPQTPAVIYSPLPTLPAPPPPPEKGWESSPIRPSTVAVESRVGGFATLQFRCGPREAQEIMAAAMKRYDALQASITDALRASPEFQAARDAEARLADLDHETERLQSQVREMDEGIAETIQAVADPEQPRRLFEQQARRTAAGDQLAAAQQTRGLLVIEKDRRKMILETLARRVSTEAARDTAKECASVVMSAAGIAEQIGEALTRLAIEELFRAQLANIATPERFATFALRALKGGTPNA
jgi:hypothetical protein